MSETFTVWGNRGSCPMTGKSSAYGVHTSCFSLRSGSTLFVFDAGTGLSELKNAVTEERGLCVHLFLSHVHMDHLLGLFCFLPLPAWCKELHLYGEERGGRSLKEQLDTFIGPPYWPVPLSEMGGGNIFFHDIRPGEAFDVSGKHIRCVRSEHPDKSLWYRLEPAAGAGTILVYGLDCELTEASHPSLSAFSEGADLLVLDAAYAPEDLQEKRGWGHSSFRECLALAKDCGASGVLLSHLSPEYDDRLLEELEQRAVQEAGTLRVKFAREGMVLTL